MALSWNTVGREHVIRACELLIEGEAVPGARAKGIFVIHRGVRLPAKHAFRIAYCLANDLAINSKLKFASGATMVRLLRSLGVEVEWLKGSSGERENERERTNAG